MDEQLSNGLSRTKRIYGTRSKVRPKVLQVLMAYEFSDEEIDVLFDNIFFREFNFDPENPVPNKLLTREEIYELEADIPIIWDMGDVIFARKLVQETLKNKDFATELIRKHTENWEFDRIIAVDRIIIQVAIAEMLSFEDVPPKVTINEAIEVAKEFGTEKSGIFVNGLLDKIYKELQSQNLVAWERAKNENKPKS